MFDTDFDEKQLKAAKKQYESVKKAKKRYNEKFKSYHIQIDKETANLLEQIARKSGFKTSRAMIQKHIYDIAAEHKQSIDITPF